MSQSADEPFDPMLLRASDADRAAVAQVLQTAMAEGRLSVGELQERLDEVYASKTLAELEPLTEDLPGHAELVPRLAIPPARPVAADRAQGMNRIGGAASSAFAIGIMSGATRKGEWVVPRQFTAVALMGGVEIDLTHATFAQADVTITAVALMGAVDIIVAEGITVVVSGIGLMGAFEDESHLPAAPDGPVVRINGLALMGAVDVHRPKTPGELPH